MLHFIRIVKEIIGQGHSRAGFIDLTAQQVSSCRYLPLVSSITIFSITEWKDKNNFSWLAIGADNGLILLDPATQKSFQYMNDALNNFSVSGNEVYKVFTDKQNILWLATNKGVSYIEPSKQLIETWRIPAEQKNNYTEDAGYMYSFFEDDNSYL